MKCYGKAQQGEKLPGFVQYVGQKLGKKSCMTEDVAFKCLIMAYEHRAARLGYIKSWLFRVIFNNISVILCWSVLLVEKTTNLP